jgi:hypothetical protein
LHTAHRKPGRQLEVGPGQIVGDSNGAPIA